VTLCSPRRDEKMAGTSAKEHKQAHSSLLDTLLRPIDSPRFSTYSYSCIDQALLRKLQLWVTLKLLVYVPTWVSPHLLTMVGSAAILPGVIGVAVYSADGCNTQIGLWLTLTGLGGIVWDILDNLDGKQARRTGTSSILGDFLDHTLDYITLAGMLYVFATGICMGCDQFSMIFFMLGLVAHECVVWTTWWGRRFSGILFLGAVGQTEAVILFGVGLLQTAYAGGEWWLTPALDIGATVLSRGHCIAGVIIAAFLIVAPVTNIFDNLRHPGAAGKQLQALLELWPLGVYLLSHVGACLLVVQSEVQLPPHGSCALWLVANAWPLSNLQLLACLAGAPPSNLVNLFLGLAPLFAAAAHVSFPVNGLFVAGVALMLAVLYTIMQTIALLLEHIHEDVSTLFVLKNTAKQQ